MLYSLLMARPARHKSWKDIYINFFKAQAKDELFLDIFVIELQSTSLDSSETLKTEKQSARMPFAVNIFAAFSLKQPIFRQC